MFQDKTWTAENGPVLLKGCHAVLGHLGTSLRASSEAVVRSAASLGKDRAITCVAQPYGQPLPNSLNSQLSHGQSTSGRHTVCANNYHARHQRPTRACRAGPWMPVQWVKRGYYG